MASGNAFCSKCGKPLSAGATFCPACGSPVASQTQVPVSGMDAVMKEGGAQTYWIRRIIAFAVDAVIVYVALGIVAILLAVPFLLASGPAAFGVALAGIFSLVAGVILFLYFLLADSYYGGTIGKRFFGLKVAATGGKHPNLAESAIRNVSKLYWLLLLLDVVIGLATSKQYTQKYSDRFAGTEVVEAAGR